MTLCLCLCVCVKLVRVCSASGLCCVGSLWAQMVCVLEGGGTQVNVNVKCPLLAPNKIILMFVFFP